MKVFVPDIPSIAVSSIRHAFPDVWGIYWFGSSLSGEVSSESDIDLALLRLEKTDPVMLWETAQQLAMHFGRDVDLIDLRSASTVFQVQVITGGERIDCSMPYSCDLFETTVLSDYIRLQEERHDILEDIRQEKRILG